MAKLKQFQEEKKRKELQEQLAKERTEKTKERERIKQELEKDRYIYLNLQKSEDTTMLPVGATNTRLPNDPMKVFSGKTVLANFLADATDTSSGEYHPTQGCRILEFETNNFNSRQNIEVELWDVSGDKKFESCWPAIAKDTNGVLFVYNPDQGSHGQDLAKWHECFVQNQGLKDSQCAVFAHHKPGSSDRSVQNSLEPLAIYL
ncbi:IFT22 [Mytilus edulis]|uniref:IFT22 n=1 Tax=Mytilus edulis TaxID=6550 RepID=A0A8S3T455_MYTED|nr:IFT22 [Mytilus edulis]